MKFKPRRLSACASLVNASLAAGLIFSVAACDGSNRPEPSTKESPKLAESEDAASLPAVWSTRSLEGEVAAMAVSTGSDPVLAIAYEKGGLQFFNFDAERISFVAPLDIGHISDGARLLVSGLELVVFPGVNRDGRPEAYILSSGAEEPAAAALPIDSEGRVAGICSASPSIGSGAAFQLAFWTEDAPRELQLGSLQIIEGEFSWSLDGVQSADFEIEGCRFDNEKAIPLNVDAESSAWLQRDEYRAYVTFDETGLLSVRESGGENSEYKVRDGLSVRAPKQPSAIVAVGAPLGGGYPGGVIVLAGKVGPGDYQAVFVDPSALTLKAAD